MIVAVEIGSAVKTEGFAIVENVLSRATVEHLLTSLEHIGDILQVRKLRFSSAGLQLNTLSSVLGLERPGLRHGYLVQLPRTVTWTKNYRAGQSHLGLLNSVVPSTVVSPKPFTRCNLIQSGAAVRISISF